MYKYLPSKKFAFITLSIVLALGIVYVSNLLIVESNKAPKKIALPQNAEERTKTQEFLALDSDNDGLKDWEEALWKTDPKKTDTDSDGTNDGEEIRLNRDPIKANTAKDGQKATDLFDEKIIAANKKTDEEFAKLSQTDQLAHTFFSQYLASKSASGAPLSETNKQIILDTAISMTEAANKPKYSLSDLKITNDSSTSSIETYANSLGKCFFTGTNQEKVGDVVDIINRATQSQNEKILTELDPIIEGYTKTLSKMLLIYVPNEIYSIHLKFLNDLYLLKISLEEIKSLYSDPVLAVGGIDRYQTAVSGIKKDISDYKNYFLIKKVILTPNHYGHAFFNSI